jgi:hypothetical protein
MMTAVIATYATETVLLLVYLVVTGFMMGIALNGLVLFIEWIWHVVTG